MSIQQPIAPMGMPQMAVPAIEIPGGIQQVGEALIPTINTPVVAPMIDSNIVAPQVVAPQMVTPVMDQMISAPAIQIGQPEVNVVMNAPYIEQPQETIVAAPAVMSQEQYIMEQTLQQTPIQQELGVVPAVTEIPQVQEPVSAPIMEVQEIPTMPTMPTIPDLPPVTNNDFGIQNVMQNGLDLTGHSPEDNVKLEAASKEVTPISVGGLVSVGNCNVAGWGGFLKVLSSLTKDLGNDDVVSIENGILDTNKNGIFIHCDLKNVLGNISLNLVAPQATTKKLSTIRGGELVQIFKDADAGVYHFCNILNGRILTRVRTRFATESADGFAKPPVLPGNPYIKEIGSQEQETIRTIIAGKAAENSEEPYRFGFDKNNNTLVSIGVGSDFTHFFQDSNIEVDEYKVFYPFPVSNIDSVIIKFFKFINPTTGLEETWLHVINNFDFVSVVCIEKIEKFNSSIEDFKF